MNHKERMLANLPYKSWLDGLMEERIACNKLIYEFNAIIPGDWDKKDELLRKILGKAGKDVYIEAPFHCDYGYNIEIGDSFYANYNLIILDIAKVTIGNKVMMGPNVAIYAASHPLHPESRNTGYEPGDPITIGDNVWIGGNVCILPGVTIGKNSVIGAGSVVAKDVPEGVLAIGNPCKVIRKITEDDRDYYYKDRKFDVDDYRTEGAEIEL